MKKTVKKLISMACVCTGGSLAFTAFNIYNGNEKFFNDFVIPLGHRLDPEIAHNIAVIASKYRLVPSGSHTDSDTLRTKVWKIEFSNPLGMAAGFDKQGEAVSNLHDVGFGFVEVGSITPKPQPGNPKPRVFRLGEDNAVINRYGFNSDGHDVVYDRLKELRVKCDKNYIVGVNLGKNKTSEDPVGDYVKGIKKFGDVADYLVINISSPNTPGLRDWQHRSQLKELLSCLVTARDSLSVPDKPPLLLKLAPDLTAQERKDIADVITCKECQVDGLVLSNTTVARPSDLLSSNASERGGLSGQPLCEPSTALIRDMYKLTKGKIPIIGVGGIFSGKDAYEKIRAGASLVQIYTSYIYHGPPRVSRIKEELEELIRADGLNTVSEAVGKGAH